MIEKIDHHRQELRRLLAYSRNSRSWQSYDSRRITVAMMLTERYFIHALRRRSS